MHRVLLTRPVLLGCAREGTRRGTAEDLALAGGCATSHPAPRLHVMRTLLERLTEAQNAHDVELFASCFAPDYLSEQPALPGRPSSRGEPRSTRTGPRSSAGVPDFRGELLATCRDRDVEWGELSWHGHHRDGAVFAMRGVIHRHDPRRADRLGPVVRGAGRAARPGHRGCGGTALPTARSRLLTCVLLTSYAGGTSSPGRTGPSALPGGPGPTPACGHDLVPATERTHPCTPCSRRSPSPPWSTSC